MTNKKSRLLVLNYPFVLALKKHGEERYSLIGGNIESYESPLESILREAEEEAGIKLSEEVITFVNQLSVLKGDVKHERNYFLLENIKQKFRVSEPEKFESIEWIDFYDNKHKFKKLDRKAIVSQFILSEL